MLTYPVVRGIPLLKGRPARPVYSWTVRTTVMGLSTNFEKRLIFHFQHDRFGWPVLTSCNDPKAGSAKMQNEANPAFRLAAWAGKLVLKVLSRREKDRTTFYNNKFDHYLEKGWKPEYRKGITPCWKKLFYLGKMNASKTDKSLTIAAVMKNMQNKCTKK